MNINTSNPLHQIQDQIHTPWVPWASCHPPFLPFETHQDRCHFRQCSALRLFFQKILNNKVSFISACHFSSILIVLAKVTRTTRTTASLFFLHEHVCVVQLVLYLQPARKKSRDAFDFVGISLHACAVYYVWWPVSTSIHVHVHVCTYFPLYIYLVDQCGSEWLSATFPMGIQWSSRASVDGIDLDSVSTLCRTTLLILASHVAWWL